jgi:hypothetical protein
MGIEQFSVLRWEASLKQAYCGAKELITLGGLVCNIREVRNMNRNRKSSIGSGSIERLQAVTESDVSKNGDLLLVVSPLG